MNKDLLRPLNKPALQGQRPVRRTPKPLAERTTSILIGSVSLLLLIALFLPEGPSARASGREMGQRGQYGPAGQIEEDPRHQPHPELHRARYDDTIRLPIPKLDPVNLIFGPDNSVHLTSTPRFSSTFAGRIAARSSSDDLVLFTLDPQLQTFVDQLVNKTEGPHLAVVAMDPYTGEILAMAGKSSTINEIHLHSRFPAASLFKVVTSAAALEQSKLKNSSVIRYRGGVYTLNKSNYLPDRKRDVHSMQFNHALGKSCNPVFARVALNNLKPLHLRDYAFFFGFNVNLPFELPLEPSVAFIPDDPYGVSRTAAGFGKVTISPVHAAAFISAVANGGILPRPTVVKRVVKPSGLILHESKPEAIQQVVGAGTAGDLMEMLHTTTTVGTSRGEFHQPSIRGTRVAAKTGTLRGDYPAGINQWFIAAAPIENPRIAVAVITVRPSYGGTKASRIGRLVLERYLNKP